VPQLLVDGILVALAYYLAFRLRFEASLGGANDRYGDLLAHTIFWVVPVSLVTLAAFGQYQRLWTFVGQRDYEAVVKGLIVATLVIVGAIAFLTVDITFFAANLTKVVHGGWFPLAIALIVFSVLTTWQRGREIVTTRRTQEEGPLRAFVEEVRGLDPPVARVPGTAVFLTRTERDVPPVMVWHVKHNRALHENLFVLTVRTGSVPWVKDTERLTFGEIAPRFWRAAQSDAPCDPREDQTGAVAQSMCVIKRRDPASLPIYFRSSIERTILEARP
jgi:hypothetical protein